VRRLGDLRRKGRGVGKQPLDLALRPRVETRLAVDHDVSAETEHEDEGKSFHNVQRIVSYNSTAF
jgi:hypothetical protein